jgi:hypothetical protein
MRFEDAKPRIQSKLLFISKIFHSSNEFLSVPMDFHILGVAKLKIGIVY